MKKLFFAALIALAGFTACGTKNVETAATEATEQREVGGGDIAYVQVEAVLAQSDLYNAEGIALKDKTEKAQKSWAQKEQNFQYEVAQLQEKYQKGLITTNDAQSTQENIERRIASYQAALSRQHPRDLFDCKYMEKSNDSETKPLLFCRDTDPG